MRAAPGVAAAAPEHRADAVFCLPRLPRTAAVVGTLPGWTEDLHERRIELVDDPRSADLVVADAAHAAASVGAAPALIADGGARLARELRARYETTRRLLPLPVVGSPVLFVDLGDRRAAGYAIKHGIVHPQRWRNARNSTAAHLAGAGLLPFPQGAMTLGSADGPPAHISAAVDLTGLADPEWVQLVAAGSIVRRNAFLLLPQRSSTPTHVVKFSRVPELKAQFDRDERAAELVGRLGGAVARYAPSYLGRFEVDGRTASVESAAVGTKLTNYLRRTIPRAAKLDAVERVAGWLVDVARETATPPEALAQERDRLEREVLPFWDELSVPPDLIRRIPPVPATFQHYDVAEENVVVHQGGFTVLDWEWSKQHGLPLSDLVYFGVHVLRIVDGALTEEARDAHFVDVLTGTAPGSEVLFRWVRELASALAIPAEAVGPIVTASWLDRGKLSLDERRRAEAVGAPLEPAFAERAARAWMSHPQLGPSWTAWRR